MRALPVIGEFLCARCPLGRRRVARPASLRKPALARALRTDLSSVRAKPDTARARSCNQKHAQTEPQRMDQISQAAGQKRSPRRLGLLVGGGPARVLCCKQKGFSSLPESLGWKLEAEARRAEMGAELAI